MKISIFCLLLLLLAGTVFAEKAAVLPEISYPYSITAAENRLYITEETAVYIYSLEDFSLIRNFGKAGRGVGEFKGRIMLTIQPGCLFINSRGKTSCFSIEGDFIKEEKILWTLYFFLFGWCFFFWRVFSSGCLSRRVGLRWLR